MQYAREREAEKSCHMESSVKAFATKLYATYSINLQLFTLFFDK